jgi:hypothetical protein
MEVRDPVLVGPIVLNTFGLSIGRVVSCHQPASTSAAATRSAASSSLCGRRCVGAEDRLRVVAEHGRDDMDSRDPNRGAASTAASGGAEGFR